MKYLYRLKCFLFGHEYVLKRRVTNEIREVGCIWCQRQFTMNDDMRTILPMDAEFKQIHDELIELRRR